MPKDEHKQPFSLRDFCWVVFQHKTAIAVTFFAAVLAATVYSYLWPDTYEARAAILVKVGRENVSIPAVPPSAEQQVVASLGLRREDIRSEIELMNNQFLLEQVVKELGTDYLFGKPEKPKTSPPYVWRARFEKIKYELRQRLNSTKEIVLETLDRLALRKNLSEYQKAVLALRKRLSIEQIRNSDVIEIKFRWSEPSVAKKVVETLLAFYMEHHLQSHKTSGSYDFFHRQAEILEERLKDSEEKLKLLEQSHGIVSYEQQRESLLEQIDNFTAILKQTESEIAETRMKINGLSEQLSSLVTKITTGFDEIATKLRSDLLGQQNILKALEAKKQTMQNHINSYQTDLDKLSSYNLELKRLTRQVSLDEQNYKLYQRKLEEARISDVLDTERIVNVRVIDLPAASFKPVSPAKCVLIAVAAVTSLLVGIVLAFLCEYFDRSVKTAQDVAKHLGIPLIASIKRRRRAHLEEYEQIRSLITSSPLLSCPPPRLASGDAGAGESKKGGEIKVVMVSGPSGREGVSTIASNLAAVLARTAGAKVVLVDANIRTATRRLSLVPPQADRSGQQSRASPGLYELILDGVDINEAIKETTVKNLYLIAAGTKDSRQVGSNDNDPVRVFESPNLAPTLGKLKKKFDYVVLDTPAINKYSDATILSRYVDAVILVIDFGRTRREVAQIAQGKLVQNNAKVFAAVLNRRKYFIPNFIYKRL